MALRRRPTIEAGDATHHGPSELAQRAVDLHPGARLAGYQVEAVAGRGGMGVVYRANHLHLDRTVALKVLSLELVDTPGFRERFMREARTAASISHPGMIPVYDAGEAEGELYIAMQYVDGTDLGALLREEGALEPRRVVSLLRQIAGALDVAHGRGIVHRDVKPANILIDGDLCYLTDFGLTKQISSETMLTARGQFVGTVHYMAPEQVEGLDVDTRADVYGLACVAFHALTGRPPFERDSDVSVAMAHLHERPPALMSMRPDLPTGMDAVLARALAKRRQDRQATCGELVAALDAALHGAHGGDDPSAPAEPTGKLLVAAPEPGMRALVRASVKGRGLQVLEAADASSAVVIARREQPEVALVDLGMAERELRDDPETAGIRIVSMTSGDELEAPDGADELIRRPFSPLQLLHAIRRVAGPELVR